MSVQPKAALTIFLLREVDPIENPHHQTRLLLEFAALISQFLRQLSQLAHQMSRRRA